MWLLNYLLIVTFIKGVKIFQKAKSDNDFMDIKEIIKRDLKRQLKSEIESSVKSSLMEKDGMKNEL